MSLRINNRIVPAVAVWLVLCALGVGVLWSYAQRSGEPGHPAGAWPLADRWPLGTERPTLVMFVHPRCPCTAASLSELARLQGRHAGRFATRIVSYEPEPTDPSWRTTALWRRAGAMTDTQAVPDPDGRIARACGAMTSGTVGLYAQDGALLFWGGLTPARGHEGPSVGADAIGAMVSGQPARATGSPVFGCSLLGACVPATTLAGGLREGVGE